MKTEQSSRRTFLAHLGMGVGAATLVLTGCKRSSSTGGAAQCDDLSAVPDAQRQIRQTLKYQAQSAEAGKHCANCKLYKPPVGGASCGGCQLFQGPVSANAYCMGWQAKV